jgi:hypothetical protein
LIPRLEKVTLPSSKHPSYLQPQIVHNEFPIPSVPILPSQLISSSLPTVEISSQDSTQSTNKENAPPSTTPAILPPVILTLLNSIESTLTSLFTTYPPHTIQRLAELLLKPKHHYRTLPSYLHALDRVVHVTSGANVFPLPPAIPDPSSLTVLSNGTSSIDPLSVSWGNPASTPTIASTLGSDESLGGALLTPITWLQKNGIGAPGPAGSGTHSPLEGEVKTESTETIDGPNGPGGVETVSVAVNGISSTAIESLRAEGGVTQGELLRQEQRAGVVPAAQLREGNRGDTDGKGEEDEIPHARGPEEIGMEDMGPQAPGGGQSERLVGGGMAMQGIDVEAAVGRKLTSKSEEEEKPGTPKREADEEMGGESKRARSESGGSEDEEVKKDTELVDAEGESKISENGEDAVDTSTV